MFQDDGQLLLDGFIMVLDDEWEIMSGESIEEDGFIDIMDYVFRYGFLVGEEENVDREVLQEVNNRINEIVLNINFGKVFLSVLWKMRFRYLFLVMYFEIF